jgi:hypothetical protein
MIIIKCIRTRHGRKYFTICILKITQETTADRCLDKKKEVYYPTNIFHFKFTEYFILSNEYIYHRIADKPKQDCRERRVNLVI